MSETHRVKVSGTVTNLPGAGDILGLRGQRFDLRPPSDIPEAGDPPIQTLIPVHVPAYRCIWHVVDQDLLEVEGVVDPRHGFVRARRVVRRDAAQLIYPRNFYFWEILIMALAAMGVTGALLRGFTQNPFALGLLQVAQWLVLILAVGVLLRAFLFRRFPVQGWVAIVAAALAIITLASYLVMAYNYVSRTDIYGTSPGIRLNIFLTRAPHLGNDASMLLIFVPILIFFGAYLLRDGEPRVEG